MSIKRKNKSSQITIPCLYINVPYVNWRIPITAISSIEFNGSDTKIIFNNGTVIKRELPEESIKLLRDLFPTTICMK